MTTLIDELSGNASARTNGQLHVTVSNSNVAEDLSIRHGGGVSGIWLIQHEKTDDLVLGMV